MKIASASPPVVFLLSGHTVVLLVAASVLPVGFSRCGRVPIPALGPYLSPRLAARSACHFPACVKSRIRLPVPPPTRLVSTASSLCFPRPACAPACVKTRIRLPVPPPTRLVSTASSLCFPRPACAPACMKARIPIKKRRPPRLWKPSVRPFAAPQGAKCFGCGRPGARFPAFVPGCRSPLVKTPAEAGAPGR